MPRFAFTLALAFVTFGCAQAVEPLTAPPLPARPDLGPLGDLGPPGDRGGPSRDFEDWPLVCAGQDDPWLSMHWLADVTLAADGWTFASYEFAFQNCRDRPLQLRLTSVLQETEHDGEGLDLLFPRSASLFSTRGFGGGLAIVELQSLRPVTPVRRAAICANPEPRMRLGVVLQREGDRRNRTLETNVPIQCR